MSKKIFVAQFDSRHFVFHGAGATKAEAAQALRRAVSRHIEQTGADATYFEDVEDEANYLAYEAGCGYRDNQQIVGRVAE